jgi:ribose transport system ATP-binding protein
MSTADPDLLLEVHHITKRFGRNVALNAVSLQVHRGEVVALCGHNGSGKSTLAKVLSGFHHPDDGELRLGEESDRTDLHFIHQNLGLIGTLSAVENLGLTTSGTSQMRPINKSRERFRVRGLIQEFGGDFDVDRPVASLSPAEQTIVALTRAFDRWTGQRNVLVLDEPTAALHGGEVDLLQTAVRAVAARGAGVIYISHRLNEVAQLADRVVVLRDGNVVAERTRGHFDVKALVNLIAGAELPSGVRCRETVPGPVRLSVRRLRSDTLNGIDFDVHSGEVVGVGGLIGSGMEQLCGVLFGGKERHSGCVFVDGCSLIANRPHAAIKSGVAYVPADRRGLASIATFTAAENLTLPKLQPLATRIGTISLRRERQDATQWLDLVGVVPAASAHQRFDLFSGGNQQKIVLAKWLRTEPRVLLLEEPTQGVDVGAQADIYELIAGAACRGAAVLVSSSDSKELAAICDRVVVLRDGQVSGELHGEALNETTLVRAVLDDSEPVDRKV